jgi:hypothetical protein
MYEYASRVMQSIAKGDDALTLALVKEVYIREVNAMAKRNLGE